MSVSADDLKRFALTPSDGDLPYMDKQRKFVRFLIVWSVIGGLTFNLVLCFVNTRIMSTWETYVGVTELSMTFAALLAALDKRLRVYMFLLIFVSYMMLLFVIRGESDVKAVRDIIVPVAFYFMGRKAQDLKLADKLLTISVAIVVFFGLFEYFLTELFLDYFNVLGYYLARGSLRLDETMGATRGLFISGTRPEPRTILPFLGQHRVASVFLEPVSAGNFGVIAYAWTLFRSNMRWRWWVMVGGMSVIVMADARFGLYTCALITLLTPFYRIIPRTVWFVMPFIMLALIAAYGIATGTEGGPNDLFGRMQVTAHILTQLDLAVVLGFQTTTQFTADSGLAYTLTKFGIGGFMALWAALVFAPIKDARGWIFHAMVITYLLLLMIISNSFYSIKTGAVLWFLLGTADTVVFAPRTISWTKFFKRKAPQVPVQSAAERLALFQSRAGES